MDWLDKRVGVQHPFLSDRLPVKWPAQLRDSVQICRFAKMKPKAKLLDKIVVVDVEATCWRGKPPEGEVSEIIEIGICLLEVATGEVTANKGILIRPTRSRVSAFCTELTTLTQEQVDTGILFKDACQLLREEYLSKDRVWASYGDYDRKMFHSQSEIEGVPYPFGTRHINVKTLCALRNKWSKETGMARAMERLKMPLIGTHHRGVDDAFNIAKILQTLL